MRPAAETDRNAEDPRAHELDIATALASTDPERAIASVDWLEASIAADRDARAFTAWGQSTVIDENTRDPVIGAGLFGALHRYAGIEATWPVGNAGLIHCYGYLLSLAATPYGLKRERWLTSDLARAAGLPDDALTPWRPGPTLLSRAAELMTVALHDAAPHLDVPVPIADRIVTSRIGILHSAGMSAVAYSVAGRLITAFPMTAPPERIRADLVAELPRLRWNAVLSALGHPHAVS
ncbi:amino acid deaminase [Microbacterium sp. ZW T5_56]|uniref:amino acid deaminase n=1 Tax=Microbacterium sp. ZW T5_56 TaxID=3378081 RepID=UPI003852291C